uniref:Uncharacterized protein n=1 Tax=Elaeophora elaphi TaxID=1147741 RepID=A0A0R3RTH1_9BILA
MVNSARKLQSDRLSSSTTDLNISNSMPLLLEKKLNRQNSQKMRQGNESEFSEKDNLKESMRNSSQNFSITGSLTSEAVKDIQQSRTATGSSIGIEDDILLAVKKEDKFLSPSYPRFIIPLNLVFSNILATLALEYRKRLWHARNRLKNHDDTRNEKKFLELLDEYNAYAKENVGVGSTIYGKLLQVFFVSSDNLYGVAVVHQF